MGRIADYLELITLDLARRPARPAFVKLNEQRNPHAGGDTARRGTSTAR
jgi:hypothetical protein